MEKDSQRITSIAYAIFLFCILQGGNCIYEQEARITEYIPSRGDPINCMGNCTVGAFGYPIEYGVTVACGKDIPYNTDVYIEDIGWFKCQDRGGAIDNDEVDVASKELHWYTGNRPTVWVIEP